MKKPLWIALAIVAFGGLEALGIYLLTDDAGAPAPAASTAADSLPAAGPAAVQPPSPSSFVPPPRSAAAPQLPPSAPPSEDARGLAAFQFSPDPVARAGELSAIRAERLRAQMDRLNARGLQAAAERGVR